MYDAGEDAGELFLVMELVDGQSLAAIISQRAPLPVDEAVSIAVQILDGLSAVHADGVIHRDVKPANVLVNGTGRAMLTDFGIAKRLDDIEENLTSVGMVVGTPTYLAPEQATGARLGIATDVYLVGLVLDEMLTGQRPAGSALDPRRARSDVPAAVADAVMRATDPDPRRRFASAQEMIAALREPAPRVATMVIPVAAAGAGRVDRTAVMPGRSRARRRRRAHHGDRAGAGRTGRDPIDAVRLVVAGCRSDHRCSGRGCADGGRRRSRPARRTGTVDPGYDGAGRSDRQRSTHECARRDRRQPERPRQWARAR